MKNAIADIFTYQFFIGFVCGLCVANVIWTSLN